MDFFDYLLPEQYSFGAKGGPVWSTEVVKTTGGQVFANRNWLLPLHAFDVSAVIRTQMDFDFFRNLFYNVYGQYSAFRFKHKDDYLATDANTSLTLISGSVWQLNRIYVSTGRTFVRPIYKPAVGSVVLTRNRGGTFTTPTATVDYTTGQVTMAGHVSGDTYTWSGQFHVPVAFTTDRMEAVISNKNGGGLLIEWPNIVLEERRM